MNDLIAKAVELFQSRSAITDVVLSADIYDTDLPPGYDQLPQARAAIVIMAAPDSQYYVDSPVAELSLEVRCYGINIVAARAVFRALYDGLRDLAGVTVGGVKWCSVWIDGGDQPKQDEATTWEFVLCTVRALVRAV